MKSDRPLIGYIMMVYFAIAAITIVFGLWWTLGGKSFIGMGLVAFWAWVMYNIPKERQ